MARENDGRHDVGEEELAGELRVLAQEIWYSEWASGSGDVQTTHTRYDVFGCRNI